MERHGNIGIGPEGVDAPHPQHGAHSVCPLFGGAVVGEKKGLRFEREREEMSIAIKEMTKQSHCWEAEAQNFRVAPRGEGGLHRLEGADSS